MDTHPIQASPQRWIVALGLLLVAGVQGLFLWGYTDDGIWVSLLDGMAATLLFALSAYWAWYVLGFVHISITTLFITILGISCTLVGSFFIRWILEFLLIMQSTLLLYSHFLSASVMWPYCGASSCYGIVCNLLRASVRRWKINW